MTSPDNFLRELLQTFQAEAAEHLQTLNLALLSLEVCPEEPRRQELVQEAFRAAHSLKGAARAVGLEDIETLSHAMESVLQEARDAGKHLKPAVYDVLYDTLDNIGHLLEGQSVAVEPLVSRLMNSAGHESKEKPVVEAAHAIKQDDNFPEATPQVEVDQPLVNLAPLSEPVEAPPIDDPAARSLATSSEETIRVTITKLDNLMAQVGELLVIRMNAEQRAAELKAIRSQAVMWPKLWRGIKMLLPQIDDDTDGRLSDLLMNYQEQIQSTMADVGQLDQHLRQDTLRLGVIASQLQDSVRHVRMISFETLVPVLQRTVRDAAHSEGKLIVFNISGSEVELDKRVLEALKDPFLHLLRNAVSHGIEPQIDREKLGKPAEGHINLNVQQRGAEVHITVRDDGLGFDLTGLRRASSDKNGHKLAENASQDDIIELAFMPGVTTSQEVTTLSGRGIGLDVVRQHLEALQGRIHVETAPGKGATIHLVVPITLTILRGLLVKVGDERYVLPMLSVEKIITLRQTFTIEGQTMVTVDGTALPLVSLASLLERPVKPQSGKNALAVIMAVAEQRLALLVDDVLAEQELAVKPLGKPIQRIRNVSGAALMGDGKPVVILNAADLVRVAKGMRKQTFSQKPEEVPEKTKTEILSCR